MRPLLLAAALALALPACDRAAAKRHQFAAEHAKDVDEALEKGDPGRALMAAQAAAEVDPLDPLMKELPTRVRLLALARWPDLVTIERPVELDYAAESMLRHSPKKAELLVSRAQIAISRSDGAAADKFVQDALAAKDAPVTSYVALGRLRVKQGNAAEAETAYRKALEAEALNIPASVGLGELLIRTGKSADAEKTLAEALKAHEDSAALHRTIAVAYFAQRKVQESGEHLQKAVQLDPASGPTHRSFAEWFAATGQIDKAEQEYAAAARLGDEPAASFGLGQMAAKKKDYARAVQLFEAVLRAQPSAVEAAYQAGLAYEAGGDAQNAARMYARFVQGAGQDPAQAEKVQDATRRLNALVKKP